MFSRLYGKDLRCCLSSPPLWTPPKSRSRARKFPFVFELVREPVLYKSRVQSETSLIWILKLTKSVKCQVVDWNEKQEGFDICHFLSTHFKLIRTNRNAQWADVSRQRNQNETTKSNLREGSRCWSRNISKKIKIEKQALWRDVAFLGKVWKYVKMSTQKKLKFKRVKLSV